MRDPGRKAGGSIWTAKVSRLNDYSLYKLHRIAKARGHFKREQNLGAPDLRRKQTKGGFEAGGRGKAYQPN